MSTLKASRVKPVVLALALALSGSAANAESIDNIVTTRPDQNIDQQYGLDSVYGFSAEAKPQKPEQTGSRDSDIFADAWHFTEGAAASAWTATTGLFKGSESASTVAQVEPEPYGRAGGYAGSDRVAVISNTPVNSETVVKTGEALGDAADTRANVSNATDTSINNYNWSMR